MAACASILRLLPLLVPVFTPFAFCLRKYPPLYSARVQLRNPLHAMLGALTVVEEAGLAPEERAWQLQSLRDGVELMIGITSDVMDLQALGAGKLRLQQLSTDVRELLAG